MNSSASNYRVAKVYLCKRYYSFKLHELRYVSFILFMVHNQLIRYTESMPDVMNYVTSAL